MAGQFDFKGDGLKHSLQHAACGKGTKSGERGIRINTRTCRAAYSFEIDEIDHQLLKGALIALILALAWCAFIAVLVYMFHIWGCDSIRRYLFILDIYAHAFFRLILS